jgi:two-component system KDP operon response regulator KdpE
MESKPDVSVLAIEDDAVIRRFLNVTFEETCYRLIEAGTAAVGLQMLVNRKPTLLLLGMDLLGADALNFIQSVRQLSKAPIIIMAGAETTEMRIKALEGGADDYASKPLDAKELLERMEVAIKHATPAPEPALGSTLQYGEVRIDALGNAASLGDQPLQLTAIEYKLLVVLVKNAGRVITHRQLLNLIWGPQYSEEAQYLRVYLGFLRKKLEPESDSPRLLRTELDVGYRLAC